MNRHTRVIHIIGDLNKGGAETQLSLLVVNRVFGADCVVTLKNISTSTLSRLRDRRVRVLCLDFSCRPIRSFYHLVRFLRDTLTDGDLIQCWMYHSNLIGFLAAVFAGRRSQVVWNLRRTTLPGGMTGLVSRLCGLISRHVKVPIVCCADAALNSHCRAGYRRENMVVIHNGIDTTRFHRNADAGGAVRRELGIAPDAFVLGMVARYAPVKGHLLLFKALKQLAGNLPSSIEFKVVLIGRGVRDATPLQPYLDDEALKPYLIFVHETDDVPRYMSAFDGLCMPSESEGFPNVVAEAMACEVVPLVTDVGESRVIVGKEGQVVAPFDHQALAEGIKGLVALSDTERMLRGINARARITALFSVEETVRKYDVLYHSILKE